MKLGIKKKVKHNQQKAKKYFSKKKRNDLIFYCLMIAYPLLQFSVFYLGVNLNSILLAFKSYDESLNASWVGFNNFVNAIQEMFNPNDITWLLAFRNSLIAYFVSTVIGIPLSLLFSYYIYKKSYLHNTFKILLILPSVLTSMVMVLVFKFFVNEAIPKLFGLSEGLLSTPVTSFPTILFYSIFTSFGTSVLMYSGSMSGISPEMIEASKIDGASFFQEFRYVITPAIYPTIATFMVVGVAGIFTNQLNLYSFFGEVIQVDRGVTIGHLLFSQTRYASLSEYPRLVALGLTFTVIAVPLTLFFKWVLEKVGPSDN